VPREALAIVCGLNPETPIKVKVEGLQGQEYEVEGIPEMNVLELACISGSAKLV
jgi:hypothetical protein